MFLQVMNMEEKMKFLEFVYKIANIDGEYAEEEIEIVNSYKNEPEEADLMNKMVKSFHLDSEVVEKIDMVAKRLQDVYDDVYTAIFD